MTKEIEYIISKIEAQGDNNKFIKLDLELYGLSMNDEERILTYGTILITKHSYLFKQFKVGDVITLDVKRTEDSKAFSLE